METLPTLPPPVSLSLSVCVETASFSPPSHSVLSLSFSLCLLSREVAQSDRCNTAVEAWAELAGCRGHTSGSTSELGGGERQSRDGTGRGDKTGLAVVVPAVAAELSSKLCLRIWVCWSERSSLCEFNMDTDTSNHPEAQDGKWEEKRWEMMEVIL